jgi:NAD(P)-dependent dehydrogenase (short-subunit alcohol dehydrogenase family)
MKIEGSVALVTGASRGLGQVFARELVRRGAATVYGAARKPAEVTEPGVTPVRSSTCCRSPASTPTRSTRPLCHERTRTIKAELSRDQELIYPPVQKFWDDALKGQG